MNEVIIRSDNKIELRKETKSVFKGTIEELKPLEDGEAIKEFKKLLLQIIEKIDEVDKNDK